MEQSNPDYDDLLTIVESYKRFTKFAISKFESERLDIKNQILRNFILKAHSLLNSICLLVKEEQEGEAMALYRLLIERYFYLEYLKETNSYQAFKDWSYIKTFESRNQMRSNPEFNSSEVKKYLSDTKDQDKVYQRLKNQKNLWQEPKLENFAKELNLSFLYSMGYDLGSSFIHPRADEGAIDGLRIMKNHRMMDFKKISILSNSILMANSILTLAANRSDINFNKYLNLYCNSITEYLSEKMELPDLRKIENVFYALTLSELE